MIVHTLTISSSERILSERLVNDDLALPIHWCNHWSQDNRREEEIERMEDLGKLTDQAQRVLELERQLTPMRDFRRDSELVNEYLHRVAVIREHWLDREFLHVTGQDTHTVRVVAEVLSGTGTETEKRIRQALRVEEDDISIYPDDRHASLSYWEDVLWIDNQSPSSYTRRVMEAGTLIVSSRTYPDLLRLYACEARLAYAHFLNQAVLCLCRAMIEITLRDLALKQEILVSSGNNGGVRSNLPSGKVEDVTANWLIKNLTDLLPIYAPYKNRMTAIVRRANPIAHGSAEVSNDEAKRTIQDTYRCIHELYCIA